jgi:mannose-6-phosphate isomerase-like protein (cupin superfamily)
MYVQSNAALPQSAIPGIQHTTLACADDGLEHLSVWRQTIEPGQATPPHRHACEEVVMVLGGSGELHVAGEVHRFESDQTLVIPANVDHQIVNSGNVPLYVLAAFSATPVPTVFPDGQPVPLPWRS